MAVRRVLAGNMPMDSTELVWGYTSNTADESEVL